MEWPHIGTEVIVAASGPSLREVDIWAPGLPICAISTAVNYGSCHQPHMWALCDRLNPNHGPRRDKLWGDESVLKLVPECNTSKGGKNVMRLKYLYGGGPKRSKGRSMMDGKLPIWCRSHKTITFAVQALACAGVKTMYICGCDLTMGRQQRERYAYDYIAGCRRRPRPRRLDALNHVYRDLKTCAEAAEKIGVKLISWTPNGRINDFMEYRDAPLSSDGKDPRRTSEQAPEVGSGAGERPAGDDQPVPPVGEVVGARPNGRGNQASREAARSRWRQSRQVAMN